MVSEQAKIFTATPLLSDSEIAIGFTKSEETPFEIYHVRSSQVLTIYFQAVIYLNISLPTCSGQF